MADAIPLRDAHEHMWYTSGFRDPAAAAAGIPTTVVQSTNGPNSSAVRTSDGNVFTLAAGEIGFIQNLDDAALAVKLGASASTTSFNFLLKAGVLADDANGGSITIDNYIGAVSVAAMTGSPRYIAWKRSLR
jgi:hypothetical protein